VSCVTLPMKKQKNYSALTSFRISSKFPQWKLTFCYSINGSVHKQCSIGHSVRCIARVGVKFEFLPTVKKNEPLGAMVLTWSYYGRYCSVQFFLQ
jgi:hypothetical protein